MTLNSHSLEGEEEEARFQTFIQGVVRIQPDILALQEVNQTRGGRRAEEKMAAESGFLSCPFLPGEREIPLKEDNYGLRTAACLKAAGWPCQWTWTGAKVGYGRYDEGLAIFTRYPIREIRAFYLTKTRAYENWKTRKALGITVETKWGLQKVYCMHLGWWNDPDEPFAGQWNRLEEEISGEKEEMVWLLGDFNAPAGRPGESWEMIRSRGWQDTYELAAKKDEGVTVKGAIDGWREGASAAMRMDYIWCSRRVPVEKSQVVFNGKENFGLPAFSPVSDHYGVLAEISSAEEGGVNK